MRIENEERRKHRRYRLDISLTISTQGIFQVIDISRGGFCFRCPPATHVIDLWETDIVTSVASLAGFPAERVWVSVTENSAHESLPMVIGAKFGKLTKEQDSLLSKVIDDISGGDNCYH